MLALATASTQFLTQPTTRFVMMHTRHRGNVGAAARAMKTMGFDDLVLVQPSDSKVLNRKETIIGASGANDVLAKARVCATLEEAMEGIDHWCATGMPNDMRHERPDWGFRAPRVHFEELLAGTAVQGIGFVFGNERYGMEEIDIQKCHAVLGIPTNPKFGSLNVASAVQLIAYDWREAIGGY